VKPDSIDEVYYGTCIPAEYALFTNVPARQVTLGAGLPDTTISLTIDRACCSSMTAIRLGYQAIKAGIAQTVIAAGAENMGNTPLIARAEKARWGSRLGPIELEDVLWELGYGRGGFAPVASDTGEVAAEYGVTRAEQDAWSLRSHQRWFQAYKEGKYETGKEIVPIAVKQRKGDPIQFERDESPREDTSLERLSKLPTIYNNPTVTAGNAPGMNSGASAILLMSREAADKQGFPVLGTVEAVQCAAGAPKYMACIPAVTIEKMLKRHGTAVGKMDLIEINEAFAAVTLVSLKMLAGSDAATYASLQERTNVNGGAIAIGHPVGASGARITMALLYELRRRGGGQGVASICGGLSQGEALLVSA
jgi:acetyl-CoA C-acetyltransferase